MARPIGDLAPAIGIDERHPRVEVEVAEAGVERIAMLGRHLQHRVDHRVGEEAAAGLARAGLGDVEADVHGSADSTAPPLAPAARPTRAYSPAGSPPARAAGTRCCS